MSEEVRGERLEVRSDLPAIDRAKALYEKMKKPFPLDRYLREGYVISLPNLFMMAASIELEDGRKAWYIDVAVGQLPDLLRLLPWTMPFIAFARHKSTDAGRMRVYETAKITPKINHLRP